MEACCSRFTAAEGGTRLSVTAGTKNTLAVEYASFISTRLIYEEAYRIRGSLFDGYQRSVYITRASRVPCVSYELSILTDLSVIQAIEYTDVYDWCAELDTKEVLVCTSTVLRQILDEEMLSMSVLNVLIIDSCHLVCQDVNLQHIMKLYKSCDEDAKPRILALTYPLFTSKKDYEYTRDSFESISNKNEENKIKEKTSNEIIEESREIDIGDSELEDRDQEFFLKDASCSINVKTEKDKAEEIEEMGVYKNWDDFDMYEKLEWKIEELEKQLCCQMDLAEDIDGGKRMSSTMVKPKELIIEYSAQLRAEARCEEYIELDQYMRDAVKEALDFFDDHRYDPTEIYGDDLYEEFMNIPNPTIEPRSLIKQFLYILDQLGPYGADKAAFSLLTKLEKLKIKVPYERHFLLLCICTTVFVKIRCHADSIFSKYESEWDKMRLFCTPKVLRLAEILEKFQPPDLIKELSKVAENVDNMETNKISGIGSSQEVCIESLRNNVTKHVEKSQSHSSNNIDTRNKENLNANIATNNEILVKNEVIESVSSNSENIFDKNKMLNEIEKCDFKTLGNEIEDKINTIDANLKDLNEFDYNTIFDDIKINNACDFTHNKFKTDDDNKSDMNLKADISKQVNLENNKTNEDVSDNKIVEVSRTLNDKPDPRFPLLPRRAGRPRGRGRPQRNTAARNLQNLQTPDALCGIVFMNEALMAKIMFMLIVDMSRSRPPLSMLSAVYCATEEANKQGKKQEDVLNKFRMHESNLLLATTSLEEGVDLPRCNMVLRWDLPPSYRSYGLCRGRARSVRATCALLSTNERDITDMLLHNLAVYRELDQIITRKCGCGIQDEPPQSEEEHADNYTTLIKPYTPVDTIFENEVKTNDKLEEESNSTNKNSEKEICDKIIEDNEIVDKNNQNFDVNSISVLSNFNNESNTKDTLNNILEANENDISVRAKNNDNVVSNMCNAEKSSANNKSDCVGVSDSKEKKEISDIASVDLNTAIALINRYCGKLPSDTFTRLAPQWSIEDVQLPTNDGLTKKAFVCTLRLPLNSPVKYNIVGHPMPTKVLARRMVALQACRILHKSGELDNQLMPIGKENFKAAELDSASITTHDLNDLTDNARPGTTKRRQYYYKRTAWAFTDCQPVIDTSESEINSSVNCEAPKRESHDGNAEEIKKGGKRNMLYAIVSKLWCALPERYNTRGRRLHAPQNATQALGILMARDRPDNLQIPAFPVYTRSGEVRVSVEHVPDADVRMSPRRGRLVRRFMRFVFAEVLRVRRKGMKLQSEGSTHNNYYIVPTVKNILEDGKTKIDIDWQFLELIYQHTEEKKNSDLEKPIMWHQDEEELDEEIKQESKTEKEPKEESKVKKMENPLLKAGDTFVFDPEVYREAVVTPWYRNQDQPQFFLVAEICGNLTPDSAFPSATHKSFREYYSTKYGVVLTQPNQPLLDVDHTSARLNLLTPRYVNRKGVALPVSSERTRRAKRDRLDQKQILVPELCRVHPFAAPLWFATVALPCVLYRINALLIADEIRRSVAIDVGLGIPKIDESTGFQWPPLDFGWSLAEVLNADTEKNDKKKDDDKGQDKKEDKDTNEKTDQADTKPSSDEENTKEKTINDILQEKEEAERGFEIGTWSNDMASSIPQSEEFDEYMEPLPSNLTFCTSVSGGTNWADAIQKPKSQFQPSRTFSMADSDCSYMSSDFDTDDSDLNSVNSDEDSDMSGFTSSKNSNVAMGVRIEYKTPHEAEAVDLERRKVKPAPQPDEEDDKLDRKVHDEFIRSGTAPEHYIKKFHHSVEQHRKDIVEKGHLIHHDKPIEEILPGKSEKDIENVANELAKIDFEITEKNRKLFEEIFPYKNSTLLLENGKVTLDSIEKNKRVLLSELKESMNEEDLKRLEFFSMVDVDIDAPNYVNEKVANVGFDTKDKYIEKVTKWNANGEFQPYYIDNRGHTGKEFDFDHQPDLENHPGPSPSVILQALTMSNANDGINLERLETIGDSFLKFAITAYLYCAHPNVHEGKLSHMRSKQVSNLNLYRLGRNKRLGARMIASKFEPHDNWLPPCHKPPPTLHPTPGSNQEQSKLLERTLDGVGCFIPYNLITQHSIPDKSIADCVEALIGAYLLECGPRGALLFMSWLGIKVLPKHEIPLPHDHPFVVAAKNSGLSVEKPKPKPKPTTRADGSDSDSDYSEDETCLNTEKSDDIKLEEAEWAWKGRPVGSLKPYKQSDGTWMQPIFGELKAPPSPLLRYIEDPEGELERMLSGYDALERTLQYRFKDRSLLLQALTHASHHKNRLTDCYQRLEFLGDAILDYLITRHLYCDPRRHSPGALTDLRSALVNNTIFATLAAKHGFHKYFRHMSPGLNEVLTKYVKIQEENGHSISEEHYLIHEDEMEQAEDVEVPKALGDLFESVAGAIFLDSGMSLGAVWKSYVNLMGAELEAFSAAAPKSPVRELLEAEPDTAKFGKPERLADGRRVRVCVEVFGRGTFKGIGRNYRIAKGTAARCALRHLREHRR